MALIVIAGVWLFLSQPRLTLLPSELTVAQTELSTSKETLTTTSTTTSTQRSEMSLEYTLTIQDPASGRVHIKGTIHNPQGNQVVLGRGQGPSGSRHVPPMTNLVPENVLPSHSDRFVEVIVLLTNGQRNMEFEYDADLSPRAFSGAYAWYLNAEFGVVEPEYLIFFPVSSSEDRYVPTSQVTIHLDLPDGWEVLTHWDRVGDHYRARSTPDFILGFLGFGRFEKLARDIGGINVTIAFTGVWSPTQERRLSDDVFTLYDYYTRAVGRIADSTYLPRDRYVVLFVPSPDGHPLVSNREAAYGYFSSFDEDEQAIAHRVFHEWNSDSGAFFGGLFQTEGLTTYYEYHVLLNTGLWPRQQYQSGLINQYNEYLHDIMGTYSDVPLEPYRSDVNLRLYYCKGAVVGYLLNEAMNRVTSGQRDMDDLMRYLFDHWAIRNRDPDAWYSPDQSSRYFVSANDLLRAVDAVTGHDFTKFFDAYVFGMAQLPLSVQGGELRIRYDELPLIILEWSNARIGSGTDYWNSTMIALKHIEGRFLLALPTSDVKQWLLYS